MSLGLTGLLGCTLPGVIIGTASTAGVAVMSAQGIEKSLDDVAIRLALTRKLLSRTDSLFLNLSIDLSAGRVMITGTVPNEMAFNVVEDVAHSHAGVRRVFNHAVIGPPRSGAQIIADSYLVTRLRTKILFDADVSAVNFILRVHLNVVYIIGIASTVQEAERVVNHARTLDGVEDIKLIFETTAEIDLVFQAHDELEQNAR